MKILQFLQLKCIDYECYLYINTYYMYIHVHVHVHVYVHQSF